MTSTATAVPTDAGGEAVPRRDWAWPTLVGGVLALAAVAWLYEGRGVTFFIDEWEWIVGRNSPSAATLLEPYHNHWMSVPIAIHQVLYRVFGIDSHVPYRVVLLAVHLTSAGLAFAYLRRRIGGTLALAATAVFAFYGYAWTITLWPISLGWAIATAAAIAAFLLIDHDTRRADVGASALLIVGVASTSVAMAFIIGLAAELAMRRAWRRLWVVAAPVVLYAAWYIAYGSGTNDFSAPGTMVRFMETLLAKSVATFVGIDSTAGAASHALLAVVAVGFVVIWFVIGRPITPRLIGLLIALGSYAALLAAARASTTLDSYGVTTWYSYPAALLVLLLFGELLRDRVAARPLTVAILILAAWAVLWNLGKLSEGGDQLRDIARLERAQLLAMDLASDHVPPGFAPENTFLKGVTAGAYFEVEDEFGTPAYTVRELRDAPRDARRAADKVLLDALGIEAVAGNIDVPRPSCTSGAVQRVESAVVLVEGAGVRIGVFDPAGVPIEHTGGPVSRIDLPPLGDPSARWVIRAKPGARVCTLPGSAGGLT